MKIIIDGKEVEVGRGADGFSPTVSVTQIDGGHQVTITDAEGQKSFDVMDGQDAAGGGEVYSTEETKIGTWIDGKPLYRKVIVFTVPTDVTVNVKKRINLGQVSSMKTLVSVKGVLCNESAENIYPFPHEDADIGVTADAYYNSLYVHITVLNSILINRIKGKSSHCIAEYTKIND